MSILAMIQDEWLNTIGWRWMFASEVIPWLHCASLGEYEQGLPVFQALKKHYKDHKFVMTFFSPSGYEIRKNNPIASFMETRE